MCVNIQFIEFNQKFKSINIDFEDDDLAIYSYGVICDYNTIFPINFKLFKQEFLKNGISFCENINGSFLLYIDDKKKRKKYVVTDQFSDQSVYYTTNNGTTYISNYMWHLTSLLKKNCPKPSLYGFRQIVGKSHFFEDYTPFANIRKLKPGHYLEFDTNANLFVKEYHKFEPNKNNEKLEVLIPQLTFIFNSAVHRQFNVDTFLGYDKSYSLLSGGMDSRNTAMTAIEQGVDLTSYTFGHEKSLDVKAAKKITKTYKIEHEVLKFTPDDFYNSILKCVELSDGLLSIEHLLGTFKNGKPIDYSKIGVLHTGHNGDTIGLGPSMNEYLGNNLSKFGLNLKNNAENQFIQALYQFSFNRDLSGNKISRNCTIPLSPYLDLEFVRYTLGIPEKLKAKRKLYLEWIIKDKSNQAKIIWARTNRNYQDSYDLFFNGKRDWGAKIKRKLFRRPPLKDWDTWINNQNLVSEIDKHISEGKQILLELQENELLGEINQALKTGNVKTKLRVCTFLAALIIATNNNNQMPTEYVKKSF